MTKSVCEGRNLLLTSLSGFLLLPYLTSYTVSKSFFHLIKPEEYSSMKLKAQQWTDQAY